MNPRILLLALVLAVAAPAWGQLSGWSREELVKYTPLWKGERFPDGRPKVPDATITRIQKAELTSEEAAWGPLRIIHGYDHQWDGDWKVLNRKKRLIGRVFTCQYLPGRPEMSSIIEKEAQAKGLSQHNVRVMDMLQPGDVIVADMTGRVKDGVFIGDNLAAAIFSRTGNGLIINGSIRDLEGIEPLGFPVYSRGVWPGVFGDLMLTGINVPVRIGDVTVMPGDIVVGDSEGVTFIPPHVVDDVVDNAEIYDVVDEWRIKKYMDNPGKFKPSDLYGAISMRDPALQKECEEYARAELKKRGLKPLEERATWRKAGYSGTGCYPSQPRPAVPADPSARPPGSRPAWSSKMPN